MNIMKLVALLSWVLAGSATGDETPSSSLNYGASLMQWTSEEDWEIVVENLRFCAQAARAAQCKGILWDAEPYGHRNPWRYREDTEIAGRRDKA